MTPEDEFLAYILNGGYEAPPIEPAPDPFVEQVFPEVNAGVVPGNPFGAQGLGFPDTRPAAQKGVQFPLLDAEALQPLPYVPPGGGNFFDPGARLDTSQIIDLRNDGASAPNPLRDFLKWIESETYLPDVMMPWRQPPPYIPNPWGAPPPPSSMRR